jgi:ribonuclease HI
MKPYVELYTDGSALGNPGFGGYGVVLIYEEFQKTSSGSAANTTNNVMELVAVTEGLKLLTKKCTVLVHSDSSYVVNGINSWLRNWVKKGFEGIKNREYWEDYLKESKKHSVRAVWIRGHNGHEQNEIADKLARTAAEKLRDDTKDKHEKNNNIVNTTNKLFKFR